MRKDRRSSSLLSMVPVAGAVLTAGCAPVVRPPSMTVPAREYSQDVRSAYQAQQQPYPGRVERSGEVRNVATLVSAHGREEARARLRFAADGVEETASVTAASTKDGVEPRLDGGPEGSAGYTVEHSSLAHTREYQGPLHYGDPGVTASLWQESRTGNELFRDDRAWQPMDLITIVVSERSEGKKEANTEIKSKSTVEAAIDKFLGLETDIGQGVNDKIGGTFDPTALLKASTQNDFKGEGKTNRKGSLTAKLSAMVAEVLPSGVLRIEGKKIISVNNEEQIMVISGLVRQRDINSDNEVDSSKIAQLRIDYFGDGTVGESQRGGWLGRMLRTLWPF